MSNKALPEKGLRKSTDLCRQLFLYGNGDGKPISNVARLSELSGCHPNTVRNYIDKWMKEREEIVIGATPQALALHLSAKELQLHNKDMMFLRSQIDQVEWEVENLDRMLAKLEKLTDRFADTEMLEMALSTFQTYVAASGNKQKLRQQFLQLQKQWTSLVGVDALQDVALTRAKADATLSAKMDARKAEATEGVRDVTPAGLGVFRRGN